MIGFTISGHVNGLREIRDKTPPRQSPRTTLEQDFVINETSYFYMSFHKYRSLSAFLDDTDPSISITIQYRWQEPSPQLVALTEASYNLTHYERCDEGFYMCNDMFKCIYKDQVKNYFSLFTVLTLRGHP